MRPTLATLFDLARKSVTDGDRAQVWAYNTDERRAEVNFIQALEAGATVERAQQIFASALFLILDDWIDGLADALEIGSSRAFGEKIHDVHLADLIRAAGNNFRHYRAWKDDPQRQARENIRILEAAGIRNVRDVNVSSYAFQVVSVATYEELDAKLRASEADARSGHRPMIRRIYHVYLKGI